MDRYQKGTASEEEKERVINYIVGYCEAMDAITKPEIQLHLDFSGLSEKFGVPTRQ